MMETIGEIIKRLLLFLLLLLGTVSYAQDIRVLIDVSGSMKKSDPLSLRVPATQLLANLIPAGNTAGMWIFATTTEVLVPENKVTTSWKDAVGRQTYRIHSNGKFTNIRLALETVTGDWIGHADKEPKIVIMLTDGKVDIAKDDAINMAEKQKIYNALIPKLKENNIKVYTIGLSSDSDIDLLRKLAYKTNGLFQIIHQAEKLESSFYNVFSAGVESTELPITRDVSHPEEATIQVQDSDAYPEEAVRRAKNIGGFNVDHSVKEITLVLIHKHDATFDLIQPGGKPLPLKATRVFKSKDYTFITIKKPNAGRWQIKGLEGDDNRAIILTDFDLKTKRLPTNLFTGEKVELGAYLINKGQRVEEYIITNNTEVDTKMGVYRTYQLNKPNDLLNEYHKTVNIPPKTGRMTIETIAIGKTFQRAKKQLIFVHRQPFKLTLTKINGKVRKLTVIGKSSLIEKATAKAILKIEDSKEPLVLKETAPLQFETTFKPACENGQYQIYINITGIKADGKKFTMLPLYIKGHCPKRPYFDSTLHVIENNTLIKKKQVVKKQATKVNTAKKDKPLSLLTITIYAVCTLLLLTGLLVVVLILLKKQKQKLIDTMIRKISDE